MAISIASRRAEAADRRRALCIKTYPEGFGRRKRRRIGGSEGLGDLAIYRIDHLPLPCLVPSMRRLQLLAQATDRIELLPLLEFGFGAVADVVVVVGAAMLAPTVGVAQQKRGTAARSRPRHGRLGGSAHGLDVVTVDMLGGNVVCFGERDDRARRLSIADMRVDRVAVVLTGKDN